MDTLPRAADGFLYSPLLHFTNNWSLQIFPKKRNVEILIKGEICLPVLDGYPLSADTWAHAETHLELAHGCSRGRWDRLDQFSNVEDKSHQLETDEMAKEPNSLDKNKPPEVRVLLIIVTHPGSRCTNTTKRRQIRFSLHGDYCV